MEGDEGGAEARQKKPFMKSLVLLPLDSIGPFRLGASRHQNEKRAAEEGMPKSHSRNSMDYFFENAIQVEYEANGTASLISVCSHPKLSLRYHDSDLFDMDAMSVFRLLADGEPSVSHEYDEIQYLFPQQIVALYDADEQYDHRRGESRPVWGQIGIADAAYLEAIRKIQQKYSC